MGKSSDQKNMLLWILGGTFIYYFLSQLYFAYLSSISLFSILLGWFFALPLYVDFIASLMDLLTRFVLLLAQPLMYLVIGGLLGLLVRFFYKKYKH